MATRGISGAVRPFPNAPQITKLEQIAPYLNDLGNWINASLSLLDFKAKTIPYALSADMPPLAGAPRLVCVPDDPTYGQVLCFNGVSTSGTATGWYRLIPAGTISGSAASLPAGGTTSQMLGKTSNSDFAMAWLTPPFLNSTGGTAGQVLTKSSTAAYAGTWADPHYLTTGGTTSQVLAKTSNSDYVAAWTTILQVPTGGTASQILIKNTTAAGDASWGDLPYHAFGGAMAYSTSTQTATSGVALSVAWNAEVYDTANFHDNVTNNSRVTVGAGVSYVALSASIEIVSNGTATAGTRMAEIWKNGSAMTTAAARVNEYAIGLGDTITMNLRSPVIAVSSGDYFELSVKQNSGSVATISPAGASWLSIAVIQ